MAKDAVKEKEKNSEEDSKNKDKKEKSSAQKVEEKAKEEADRETKKRQNAEAKSKEAQAQYIKIAIGVVVSGILVALVGVGIQFAYNKLIFEPQLERTPLFFSPLKFEKGLHVTSSKSNILQIVDLSNGHTAVRFDIEPKDGETVSIDDLDWYQVQDGDGENFGKLQYQYTDLLVTIKYAVVKKQLNFFIESSGNGRNKANSTHKLIASGDSITKTDLELEDGFQSVIESSGNKTSNFSDVEHFENINGNLANAFLEKFEEAYSLSKGGLPSFYQEMGRTAISHILHSMQYHHETKYQGKKNGEFSLPHPSISFLNQHQEAYDLQVYPLIAIVPFEKTLVENTIVSWLNSINSRKEIGNVVTSHRLVLEKIQQPLFFQLLNALLKKPRNSIFLRENYEKFVYLADETMNNSIEKRLGSLYFKWTGHASGLFGLEEKSGADESSFELHCLLEDLNRVMIEVSKMFAKSSEKYEANLKLLQDSREGFWSSENMTFGDLAKGKWVKSAQSSLVPVILGLLEADSEKLIHIMQNLKESEAWSESGIRKNAESGASIAVNYLFLGSLKKYTYQSGPVQQIAHTTYSQLKNGLIGNVARWFKSRKSFPGLYDSNWTGLDPGRTNDGSLVLPIMAEFFI